jgi:single-strand DNA-binding protein
MQPHNNMVILCGNLGADPELRETKQKVPVANFKIATNERYRDANGDYQDRVEWHKITVWGEMAKVCGKHLTKGREVSIIGKLHTNKWRDKEGNERTDVEIHTTSVEFRRRPNRDYEDDFEDDVGVDYTEE